MGHYLYPTNHTTHEYIDGANWPGGDQLKAFNWGEDLDQDELLDFIYEIFWSEEDDLDSADEYGVMSVDSTRPVKYTDVTEKAFTAFMNHKGGNMDDIKQFTGEHMHLSNFYFDPELKQRLWGYATVEHAYQAAKLSDRKARNTFKQPGLTAGQAKRLGRKVHLRDDWDDVKDDVMLACLRAKFAPGTEMAQKLLDTEDAVLIEGNHWHDQYWGSCTCDTHKLIPGENRLGRLLMQVRDELRR